MIGGHQEELITRSFWLVVSSLFFSELMLQQSVAYHRVQQQASGASVIIEPPSVVKYLLRLLHFALQATRALDAAVRATTIYETSAAAESVAVALPPPSLVSFSFLSLVAQHCALPSLMDRSPVSLDIPPSPTMSRPVVDAAVAFNFLRLVLATTSTAPVQVCMCVGRSTHVH
jgi:hypothetical protein